MKIILNNVKVPVIHNFEDVIRASQEKIHDLDNIRIYKKSIDARRKNDIHYVYSVVGDTNRNIEIFKDVTPYRETERVELDTPLSDKKIVIVGMGPCGLFAGLILAQHGYKPVILERGEDVDSRHRTIKNSQNNSTINPQSNIQFGEGGAGTFSDGKLTTRIGDPMQKFVLETFVKFGAPEEILYLSKPHIGTDLLRGIIKNIREEIISLGGEVKFNSFVKDIGFIDKKVAFVETDEEKIDCDSVILAIGHSSRDTYEMLNKKGVVMEAKPFAAGVRIEHKRDFINFSQYGEFAKENILPTADYKLTFNGNRNCFSFCMCPGGSVVNASSEEGMICVNGMSEHARMADNSNSAIVVNVRPEDFNNNPMEGIEFQRKYEKLAFMQGGGDYSAPVQLAKDFLKNKLSKGFEDVNPSFNGNTKFADLRKCLPDFIVNGLCEGLTDFNRKIKGYTDCGSVLTGVEMRTSAPLRIVRTEIGEAQGFHGLFPAGEGAGYAGGIMSAAIDGIKSAVKVSTYLK